MAVTTKKTFPATTNATTTVFSPVSIQLNNQDDLDVYVTLSGGTRVLQLRQSTGSTADSNHPQVNNTDGLYFPAVTAGTTLYNYTLSTDNNTITFNSALPQGAVVFCERRTRDADSSYTTFASGSTIRATDLNNSSTESNFTAQDARNKALTIEGVLFRGDQASTNFVTTDHIVNGTIVEADIANSAVTQNKLATNSVGTPELINGSVTTDKLANDNVTLAKLGGGALPTDITVASANIVNGTITTADIGADQITNALIADNQIDSEHYVDGSIDEVHLNNNIIGNAKIINGAVIETKIGTDAVTTTKIQDGAITSAKLSDATVITSSEQGAATTNDTSFLTSAAADARFFNISSGDTIKDGQTFPDNDTTIATTAAINDRIIDLVDDVGGFVPIANETSFPTSNPDVNNGTGTLVSIKSISSTRTPSGGTVTIANGAGTGNTVSITGCGSTVLTAGFGVIVETTSTLHTYAFHRLVPKATEVTTVAGISSNVTTVATNIADINTVAADLNEGTSEIDTVATNIANVNTVGNAIANVNTTAGSIANVNTTAGSITNVNNVGNNISNVNAVAGNASNINSAVSNASNINSAVSNASNITTVAGSISNVNTTAGSIANVNTVASNISSVNNFFNVYRTGSNNPTTSLDVGDLFFNTTSNSLKVYTGSAWVDGVTATGNFAVVTGNTFTGSNNHNDNVKSIYGTDSDLEIYHASNNSYIDQTGTGHLFIRGNGTNGVLIRPKAGENSIAAHSDSDVELYYDNSKKFETTSGGVTVTGSATISSGQPALYFVDTDHNPDFSIKNADGIFRIIDETNTAARFNVLANGTVDIAGNLDVYGGIDIPADNQKLQLGASQQLYLEAFSTYGLIQNTGNGYLYLLSEDFEFREQGTNDTFMKLIGGGAVELYYNNSKKFETTSSGAKLTGALEGDSDLLLRPAAGNNNVIMQPNSGAETLLKATVNGAVELYYDNSKKFETASNGLIVTGSSTVIQQQLNTSDGTARGYIYADNTNSLYLLDGQAHKILKGIKDGAVELYFNNGKKFETTSGGVKITGILSSSITSGQAITLADNAQIHIGTGDDLKIYHDGSHSRIVDSGTGNLNIQGSQVTVLNAAGTENMIKAVQDGAVELYYDNSKKLSTISGGVQIHGNLAIQDGYQLRLGNDNDAQLYHSGSNCILSNSTGIFYLGNYSNTNLIFQTNNTNRWAIRNDGHFIPDADSTVDIGTSSTRVRNFYADTLYGNGANLTGIDTDLVSDTSPQLGGSLDVNNKNVNFGDSTGTGVNRLRMGASNDLQIYHDGSRSIIKENGTGPLRLSTDEFQLMNVAENENIITAAQNLWVKLHYDSVERIVTTGTGSTLTNSQAEPYATEFTSTSSHAGIFCNPSGQHQAHVRFGYGGNRKWQIRVPFQNGVESDMTIYNWTNNADVWKLSPSGTMQARHTVPQSNNTYDLGSATLRWRNVYTGDLQLSNEGSVNDVDGTWGNYTMQEGESDLYLINNRSGKKYKFNLTEVS